jgi:acyl carrier protein
MKKYSEKKIKKFIFDLLEEKKPISKNNKKNLLKYRYLDDGQIDSLEIFSFIQKIEVYFKIKLTPEDTNSDEFRFIGGLIKIIKNK